MTQSYRSQLRHHLQQARENIVLYRANLCDTMDDFDGTLWQNMYALQCAKAEIRQVKRQYVQSNHFLSHRPTEF
jgi:hypothetical protein